MILQGVVLQLLNVEPSQQQCRLALSVKFLSHDEATQMEDIEDISDSPPGYNNFKCTGLMKGFIGVGSNR